MPVLDDRADQGFALVSGLVAGCRSLQRVVHVKAVGAFADAPAVVPTIHNIKDRLKEILACHRYDESVLAAGIKRHEGGVAESIGEDLRGNLIKGVNTEDGRFGGREGVIIRYAVEPALGCRPGRARRLEEPAEILGLVGLVDHRRACHRGLVSAVDIDPQNLAVDLREILGVADQRVVRVADVVGPAIIAGRYVEVAVVGTKGEYAAVVVLVRLIDVQQDLLGGCVHLVRVILLDGELRDVVCAAPARRHSFPHRGTVEGIDLSVLLEFGVERYGEQTALIVRRREVYQFIPEIQEWFLGNGPVCIHDLHHTDLIHDKELARSIAGQCRNHHRRSGEVVCYEFQAHVRGESGDIPERRYRCVVTYEFNCLRGTRIGEVGSIRPTGRGRRRWRRSSVVRPSLLGCNASDEA